MSSPLVLRTAHAVAGFRRGRPLTTFIPNKRARLGYTIASHLYRNRGKYYRAAKVIGRAWRKRRPVRRRQGMGRIGNNRGRAIAKRTQPATFTNLSGSTRTLYERDLTDISKTTTNEINARQRDTCFVSGVKICMELKNLRSIPLLFNYAVVFDKRGNDQTTVLDTTDFFRAMDSDDRSTDFSIVLRSNEFHCLPLNTDRFTVLTHQRMRLGPVSTSSQFTTENNTNYRFIEKWVKLGKNLSWNDGHCQSKIWFIMWADNMLNGSGTAAQTNQFQCDAKFVTYFREPCAC